MCVVGLGASGLAAVSAAVGRGLSVLGLDAGRVAAGASGRNGGFLLGGPAPFLHDAVARWGPCAVDLYHATLAELDELADRLPAGVVRRRGSIRLAGWPGEPDAVEADDIAAHELALRAHGIAVEGYDGPLGHGIFLPDDAQTNPAVRAVLTAAQLHDRARLHEHTRVKGVAAGAVTTERGTVSAGAVVIAVDGNLERLVPALAGRVRAARLQMLATAPGPPLLDCPVYGRSGFDYAQQDASGRIFLGGGRDRFREAEWTAEPEPTVEVQGWLDTQLARLRADTPVGSGRAPAVTHRWAASAGFTADGRALCAEVAPGVVAVGGYSGTGNLVGPVAARAALALALDGTEPPAYLAHEPAAGQ